MALTDNDILWAWAILDAYCGLYIYRFHWLPLISNMIPEHAYHRLNPSLKSDIEAGIRIMKGQRQRLLKNRIAADGRPMDPRAVFLP
ncbi:hypothetical protein L873DRAFT_1829556 [Choiromyces venosus 120613-1]|uniref:Uncharacterized protein n=1 Tax=Choiromyces venosus 120613-1 TaxID=1336337 RepID=A0A3N4JH84_9PEZI|nr:hypothetical protein L873DRAFT_1829556 [Choiromyces venosus 120613-1]